MNAFDALSSLEPFSLLAPRELQALASVAVTKSFSVNDELFHEGEPCKGLWVVAQGAVKIVKTTPSGRQLLLAVQQAPSTVAEVPVFDGGPYPASAIAFQPTTAILLLKEDFLNLCRRYPDLALQFLAVFGARLRHLVTLTERITFGSVRQRLAQELLSFAEKSANDTFTLPETHEELAARLGTVREVVTRNLGRFQAEGMLRIHRREIQILSREELMAEAATEL